jgi:polysaccharide pyruvyl transferase WcaK-like protein
VAWQAEGISSLSSYIRRMADEGYAVKVLMGAKGRPALDDAAFVNSLRKASSGEWSLVEARSMSQWLETIGSAALLVSGRFHYTIASCMLDTPCVVLDSNTPKNRAICEEAGLSAPLAFSTAHLDQELWSRSDTALKGAGSRRDVKDEWSRRAARNFDGLPPLGRQ